MQVVVQIAHLGNIMVMIGAHAAVVAGAAVVRLIGVV
jgi:hypothetical protein